MTKYEELEETHAELKLKQLLWDSLEEWDQMSAEWTDVSHQIGYNPQKCGFDSKSHRAVNKIQCITLLTTQ